MHTEVLTSLASVKSDDNSTGTTSCTDRSTDASPPAQKAMQALDLASIMGAPPDFLAPVMSIAEPLARQQHQAKLAYQVGKHQCSSCEEMASQVCPAPTCEQLDHCHCAGSQHNVSGHHIGSGQHTANCQHKACMLQQASPAVCTDSCADLSLGLILSSLPQAMPQLDPDRTIARRSTAELTAAEFKKQYWKTDTPIIITGKSVQRMQHMRCMFGGMMLVPGCLVMHSTAWSRHSSLTSNVALDACMTCCHLSHVLPRYLYLQTGFTCCSHYIISCVLHHLQAPWMVGMPCMSGQTYSGGTTTMVTAPYQSSWVQTAPTHGGRPPCFCRPS